MQKSPKPPESVSCAPAPRSECTPTKFGEDKSFTPQTPTNQTTNALGNNIDLDGIGLLGNSDLLDLLLGDGAKSLAVGAGKSLADGGPRGGAVGGAVGGEVGGALGAAARSLPLVHRE